ncbi:MAG: ATP-dependent DNA ligase [Candidatus Poriferisodalaceae bacterium]|jgi:ATP-dependent DNA ligase
MALPVTPPLAPMLAKAVDKLPDVPLMYEPKWDGFRCIVFRDGDEVVLSSRNERPFNRYFPEILKPLRQNLPNRCVLDGEIVVPTSRGLDFTALQNRIHTADSRVQKLAVETPAAFVAFDLLALGDQDCRELPMSERRSLMDRALGNTRPPIYLTPASTDRQEGLRWFEEFEGAGLDGIIAKPLDGTYVSDKRKWFKLKPVRTADCVVAGFRWHKNEGVGSLMLGLYDHEGTLHNLGVASSFSKARRLELVDELAPYQVDALDEHPWAEWARADQERPQRMPGAQNRWNGGKDLSWEPLRIELVAEVKYDQLQETRFRHVTRWLRWRPDREPSSCRYDQLITPVPKMIGEIFTQ